MASSPAEAVQGATIVITMLADGPATEQAATGPDGLLEAGPGTIWVQMATVGAEWTARLASIADARGIVFVDAPVSGSEGPAQAGELVTQAAQDSGATLTLTSALLPRWRDTAASGHADDDLSAVYLTT